MSFEEALISALDFEHRIRDHYARSSERSEYQAAKDLLIALAVEEQQHVDYLRGRLIIWQEKGIIELAKLKSILPDKEWIEKGWQNLHKIRLNDGHDCELSILEEALVLENQTAAHYKSLVENLDGDGQKLFQRFLEIEDGHAALVAAEITSIKMTGEIFEVKVAGNNTITA